jgi:hypothetical protein
MFRLLTDFNDINNGVVVGLPEDVEGPRALRIGDRVLLHDDGQHEAWGTVTRLLPGLVGLGVDLSTWADAGTYKTRERDGWFIVSNWAMPRMTGAGLGSVPMPIRRSVVRGH